MPQRMTIFVSAILVIVLAAASLTARTSVAQSAADECISKPSSTAPQGSHWYYRLDRTTRRQCWYLGPEGGKVRARQAGSRMNLPAPRPPQSTAETPTETTETAASEVTSDETASAKTAAVGVPAAGFSMRWPELPKSADLIDREPASVSNSYADEQATSSQDDMPSTWPVITPADLPAAARPSQSAVKPELVLALFAGALGLAAIFAGAMFDPSNALRLAQRRIRRLRSSASSRSGDHVAPGFGDPLAAARRVDLTSKPVATTRSEDFARGQPKSSGPKSSGPKSGGPKSGGPKAGGPKRSDAGHDLEASLQRLLNDWRRAAA